MSRFYWIVDANGKGLGCVRGNGQGAIAALAIAAESLQLTGAAADGLGAHTLPYPATPYLNDMQGHPDFCMSPNECKGRTSCPRNYACSE